MRVADTRFSSHHKWPMHFAVADALLALGANTDTDLLLSVGHTDTPFQVSVCGSSVRSSAVLSRGAANERSRTAIRTEPPCTLTGTGGDGSITP